MTWQNLLLGILAGGALAPAVPFLMARSVTSAAPRPRAFLAELLVIAAAVVVLAQPWTFFVTMAWLGYVPVAVALVFIDLREKRLPNVLTLWSAAGVTLLLAIDAVLHGWSPWLEGLASGATLFTIYLLMNLLTGGAMGMGDVKLALAIGVLAGYLGWFHVLLATLIAFMVGGLVSAVLLVTKRAGRKSTMPFGPFMLFGLILVVPCYTALHDYLVVAG